MSPRQKRTDKPAVPTSRPSGPAGWWLVAVVALAVRLVYLDQIQGTPISDVLLIDAGTYDRFAHRILAGTFSGEDVYSVNPLYPYFLAGIYALFGAKTGSVFVVQAVLGAINAALLFALGRRLFGTPTAWVAGLAAACYAPYVFFCGALLTPTLVESCLLAALLLLVRWRSERRSGLLLAAGAAVGAAALGRGNALLYVPLSLLFFRVAAQSWRRTSRPWLLFTAAALALPALVTVRNAWVEGRFVPISANYAAFYVGHSPQANGLYVSPEWAASGSYADEVSGVRRALSLEAGRALDQAEVSRELLGRGVRWALAHPREELTLAARKLLFFWNHVEVHTNQSFYAARDYSGLLRTLPFGFGIVASLGLIGMLAVRRQWREHLVLQTALLMPLLTCLLFFVSSEYRLPAVAPLLLFASHAVVLAASWLAGRTRPGPVGDTRPRERSGNATGRAQRVPPVPASAWATLALLPILLWATHVMPATLRGSTNNRTAYQNYAMAYAGRGESAMALAMAQRSMAADPELGQLDRERLVAESLIEAGRDSEALAALQRIHTRYVELGRPAEANDTASSLALVLIRLGRNAEAEALLRDVLGTHPGFVSARVQLALALEAAGRAAEAEAELRRALAVDPDEPQARAALERLTGGGGVK